MLRGYVSSDEAQLLRLWNTAGAKMGYAPLTGEKFRGLLTGHPEFRPEFTFVLEEGGQLLGFVNGCAGDHIAGGEPVGYISCLILSEEADNQENTALLLAAKGGGPSITEDPFAL